MPIIAVILCFMFGWNVDKAPVLDQSKALSYLRQDYDTVMAVYNVTGNTAHLKLNRTCVGSECVRTPKSKWLFSRGK